MARRIDYAGGPDVMSMGWRHIENVLRYLSGQKEEIKRAIEQAKIGFDLGSGAGNSAYALALVCPKLKELHCVDNGRDLDPQLRDELGPILLEHRESMQDFLAKTARPWKHKADVVMIASSIGEPLYYEKDLINLAKSVNRGGVVFELNPDFDYTDRQILMTDFFELYKEFGSKNFIWIKK